ncbi:hypothetical protein FACS1894142_3480 [Spirochaetia bacterium]|nr:hypothetical protein FACS1894142_3480 [Spirochaetia bacterium]
MAKPKKNVFIDVNGEITTMSSNPKAIMDYYLYGPKFKKGDCVNYKAKSRKLKKGFPIEEIVFAESTGCYIYFVRGKWVQESQLVYEF